MSELLSEVPAAEAAAEPAVEPVVDPLAGGAAAGEVADGTVVEPVEPVAAAPTFDPSELEARVEYLDERNGQLLAALEEVVNRGGLGGAPAPGAQADPLAHLASQVTDEYGNINVPALLQIMGAQQQASVALIGQQLAPLVEALQGQSEAAVQAKGEENVSGMLDDDIARNGEFAATPEADTAARERVRQRAEAMFPDLVARYGHNPRTAEIAISRAAQEERDYLRAVRGEGASQQANRMATLAGAAADAGPGVPGAVAGAPAFKSPSEVVAYYANRGREIASS